MCVVAVPWPVLRHVSATERKLMSTDPRDVVVNSASLAGVCSLTGETRSKPGAEERVLVGLDM